MGAQKDLSTFDKSTLRLFVHDALIQCDRFWCDRIDVKGLRVKSDKSFNDVLDLCLEGSALWTCIYREVDTKENGYWELGCSMLTAPYYNIWICMSEKKSMPIFENYCIKDRNDYL